jgi:hypothetical protein
LGARNDRRPRAGRKKEEEWEGRLRKKERGKRKKERK